MHDSLPEHDLVLLGIGHTNAHVLRQWRMTPLADTRLTCISNDSLATYSGMLPGTLAGLYPAEQMQIDLVRLCAAAGARLIRGDVTGLDRARREVQFADRPPVRYDLLSIGIGSVPRCDAAVAALETVVPIKPMSTFLARLEARLRAAGCSAEGRALRVAVVGGGAGGVEIAFCLPFFLRRVLGNRSSEVLLVDRCAELLGGSAPRATKIARRLLADRGVQLMLGRAVRSACREGLVLEDGSRQDADLVVWATGAAPPRLLAELGLPTDEGGFLLTHATLQTVDDARIFAVGDAGSLRERPTPKAGVYAVRQGPVLWENLGRALRGEPLAPYRPQRTFLSLLATGDGRAIATYRGRAAHGAWCWRWKDHIDRRFMAMYQDYRPMPATAESTAPAGAEMRCGGCGGKVGSSVLAAALARLEVPASDDVLVGLAPADDAAVVRWPPGRPVAATVDFFSAPLDDPYLVGRLAALNAASDVFALGARPVTALALATIPPGAARQQEQLLYELMAGAVHEFRHLGATLVGGHTIEGPQVTVGFSLLADLGGRQPRLKGGLRAGDALLLTKPLGVGILLAAHMRALCRASWFEALLAHLLASNAAAADVIAEIDAQGVTDVTGFGLAGHLLEMLIASGVAAEVRLADVPLLAGVESLVAQGVESTLAPANRGVRSEMAGAMPRPASGADLAPAGDDWPPLRTAQFAAIFDPQTCGGLLVGVPEGRADAALRRLREAGCHGAAAIGRVLPARGDSKRLTLI